MTNIQVGLLMLLSIGGVGLLFITIGLIIVIAQKKKTKRCTKITTGYVKRNRYRGKGIIFPMVEYQVENKIYTVARKYRGYVSKINLGIPEGVDKEIGAYISSNDVVHTYHCGYMNIANKLWPIGTEMKVYYNPNKPKEAFVEKIPTRIPLLTVVYFWVGLGMIAFGFLMMALVLVAG